MRKRLIWSIAPALGLLLSMVPANAQPGRNPAEVSQAVDHDVSPPLREIHFAPPKPARPQDKRLRAMPPRAAAGGTDPVVQSSAAPLVGTTTGLNFLGVGADFIGPQGAFSVDAAPSDSNGAVGATQFVEWVNTSFAIFDKATGAVQYGPAPGNAIWTGFGGPCEANNDGDPIVKYDRAAGRWVMNQLAATGGPPFYQCLAVSTGIDATGTYERYAFQYSNLNDYPKLAVWPDAYYISYNMFQGNTFLGAKICALDRNQMLAGGPATQQCFQLAPAFEAVLPSDLDGATPPPAGAPNFIVGFGTNVLNLWKFHVDFANPANSSLTGPTAITVAAYTQACGGGACIPQLGTTQKLDSVSDRLMYRLAYRNFGDHEAMVVNHTVNAGNTEGVRWYELRNPGGTPTLYQQGTYAPDSSSRWMGSIAMDKAGNIAMGYSVSSNAMHPAIRYTGRVPGDPVGAMQAENSIIEGTGSQLPSFGFPLPRWGDYTSLAVDPGDDCTFWYTNQYLKTNGGFNWSTRVASFAFPSCLSAPATQDFFLSVAPGARTVPQGTAAPYTISVTASGGFAGTVSFSASGLPAGAVATFSPASVAGSGSSTLSITPVASTPAGSYIVTINATSGSISHSALVTVTVFVPATAVFIRTDTLTQGTWKGAYGANGQAIAVDSTNYPAYAQVNIAGASLFNWASSTTDVRALQKALAADRIASTWYSGTSFTIDINLTDGLSHQLAIYCLDWDKLGRAQTIDLIDATGGNVLDTRSLPAFGNGQYLIWNLSGHVMLRVTRTAGNNAAVSGLFFDAPAVPDFTLSATPGSRSVGQGSSGAYTVSVAPFLGFNGTVTFGASGLPAGAVASFSPASVAGSGSSTLTITTAVTTPAGSYPVTITGTSGSLSHSATVTLAVFVPATAIFAKIDAATQGTWKGVYGANGKAIAVDSTNYPAYAQVSIAGASLFNWSSSTTDVRALQKAAAADRIASTWYSGTNFTIDINITDGLPHQLAIYCLDWDRLGRAQTIDVLDATSGGVIDTRSLSAFGNGQYVIWNISGHVTLRVTRTAGNNAAVSGIFFDPAGPLTPDFSLSATPASQNVKQAAATTYTVIISPAGGFSGVVSLSAAGLPAGALAAFNPASVTNSGSSTLTITTASSTPAGSYTVTITGTSGNLSHSATVTLVVFVPAAAIFARTDTATLGTWKGVYGANGEAIPSDSTSYPAYAQVSFANAGTFTWNGSTTDIRALQKAAAADRIASTWYSASSFTIDINLLDGLSHQVAIYCLDWDSQGRAQTVDVLDAVTNNVLDSRSVTAFTNGQYLIWNITGHVKIRATWIAGANAAINGLFFDAAGPVTPDFAVTASPKSQIVARAATTNFTASVAPAGGFTGTVSLSASGLPLGAVAGFSPASITTSGSSTLTITTASNTPGGTYVVTVTAISGSLSHSVAVTLVVSVPAPAAAVFVKMDTATQGTWKGVYGANGQAIAVDSTNYAPYAQVSIAGASLFTWSGATTDVRALQKSLAADRIASTWYSGTSFTMDINLADGVAHQVAIYCLDWDRLGRAQTVDVLDAATGSVLDSRSVSAFGNGQYVVWNLTGHVTLRLTRTAGNNAVVSGLFFDAAQ